jgi:hypothetical protein
MSDISDDDSVMSDISDDKVSVADVLDIEKNYTGTGLVQYIFLKLIMDENKNVCPLDIQVYINVDDSTLYFIDYDNIILTQEDVFEKMLGCKRDIIILYGSTYKSNAAIGHSFVLLVNRPFKTVEYFDPHGFIPGFADSDTILRSIIIESLLDTLANTLGMTLDIQPLYCAFQNRGVFPSRYKDVGYCTLYSSIFVIYRLANYRIPMSEFSKELFQLFQTDDINDYVHFYARLILLEARAIARDNGITDKDIISISTKLNMKFMLSNYIHRLNLTGGNPAVFSMLAQSGVKGVFIQGLEKIPMVKRILGSAQPTDFQPKKEKVRVGDSF